MIGKFRAMSLVVAFVLCLTGAAFGQEQDGNVEGTIRDPNGAAVPGVEVTLVSSGTTEGARPDATSGFRRVVTTDEDGFFRILEVPPGFYNLTAAATGGFGTLTVENVEVVLGKTTPINAALAVGGQSVSVDVTDASSGIDPTDNKIQTNITTQVIELLPKGTNFASLLQVAPAVRNEPLSGGFQVDGASGSENTFIIDGQEVTNFRTGELNTNNNLPFQLVQELQVKSSGFEAEFGGATGGVINVVTKGGSNDFRGEIGVQFDAREFNAGPRDILFLNPASQSEFIRPNRDSGTNEYPSATLGGPILRDRLWFFASYTPQFLNTTRTINYQNAATRTARFSETYRQRQRREYTFARLDAQPFDNLRLSGSFTYSPLIVDGILPGFGTIFEDLPSGNFGGSIGTLRGAQYFGQRGGRQNANNTTGSAVFTPTPNLVLTVRGGHNFLNEKSNSYGVPDPLTNPRIFCSALSVASRTPAEAGCRPGQTNGGVVFDALLFDASKRNTIDADVSYVVNNFGGRHLFKGGYQYNGISNEVVSNRTPQVSIRYGRTIAETAERNLPVSPNAVGSGILTRIGTLGDVSSRNEGFYIQDSYQPFSRLTLNLGVRIERENVPSFIEGAPDLVFNFGDKIAPRLGFAFDPTGDGRTKIFGSFGRFFDRFKYELPRGSFGGEFFRQDYFEIFPGNGPFTSFTPGRIVGTNPDPLGGSCPLGSSTGISRCQIDRRIPSNAGLGLEFGAIDPDIRAFRQSEFTVGAERDLGNGFLVSGRFTHKQVDFAIEDAGFLTATGGEAYVIGNPGRGLVRQIAEQNGFLSTEPQRDYDAFEIRLDKRFTRNFYFNANYTLSRLYGNSTLR